MYAVKLAQRAIPEGGSRVTRKRLGLGHLRFALGDGVSEQQAVGVYRMLDRAGLLENAGEIDPRRLVGLAEVAELTNRTPQAVRAWRELPEPIVRLKAGPVYDRLQIMAFIQEHPELCGVRANA